MEYSADYDTLDAPEVSPRDGVESVDAVNATVDSIINDHGVKPSIPDPPESVLRLPTGKLAFIRELTGEAEETLSKIDRLEHTAKWMSALLAAGTDSIDDEMVTPKILKDLLLGDREALLLGIRTATFGPTIEFKEFVCPGVNCGEKLDVEIKINTIPIKSITEDTFEVKLWKGGSVKVRLPNGHDQEAMFDRKKTAPEQNTILLSRTVEGLKDAKKLSIRDRREILDQILEHSGGPQYNDVTFTHDLCGTEVPVVITAGDLFPDF